VLLIIAFLLFPIQVYLLCSVPRVQKNKQRSTKHTHKTKDRVTRTPLKDGDEIRCPGRVSSSCSTSGTRRVNLVTNSRVIYRKTKANQEKPQSENRCSLPRLLSDFTVFVSNTAGVL
jgi:hypothetical protein